MISFIRKQMIERRYSIENLNALLSTILSSDKFKSFYAAALNYTRPLNIFRVSVLLDIAFPFRFFKKCRICLLLFYVVFKLKFS